MSLQLVECNKLTASELDQHVGHLELGWRTFLGLLGLSGERGAGLGTLHRGRDSAFGLLGLLFVGVAHLADPASQLNALALLNDVGELMGNNLLVWVRLSKHHVLSVGVGLRPHLIASGLGFGPHVGTGRRKVDAEQRLHLLRKGHSVARRRGPVGCSVEELGVRRSGAGALFHLDVLRPPVSVGVGAGVGALAEFLMQPLDSGVAQDSLQRGHRLAVEPTALHMQLQEAALQVLGPRHLVQ